MDDSMNSKKSCYNCGENKLGNYVPKPSCNEKKLIWVCDECWTDWYIK